MASLFIIVAYIILISQFKQMSEGSKRNLRERRPPKSLDSDNEDLDPYGYNRHPFTKDLRAPSQLLNSEAKLFVKFINNANKSKIASYQGVKEYEIEQRRRDMQNIKEPQPVRDRRGYQTEAPSDSQRRGGEGLGQLKSDPSKKLKDIYNFKTNANNSDNQLPQKNEAFLNRIKTITMQSATNMRLLEMSMAKNKPEINQYQAAKPTGNTKSTKKVEEVSVGKGINPTQNGKRPTNEQSKTVGFLSKDKEKARQMNELQQKLGLQKTDFSNNNKIFKRSSYHVAICYHIYLKKLRQKGPIGIQIDPTIHARKLKEDMNRTT